MTCLPPPADNKMKLLTTALRKSTVRASSSCGVPESARSPDCEKRRPWRPPASKPPPAKSFVFCENPRKSLIFLKWHGRGREFEPPQVHQNFSNTYRSSHSKEPRLWSPTGVHTRFDVWAAMGAVWNWPAAHDQAIEFRQLRGLGSVGTVFHARCLLETTTIASYI
jgi:hypothetical protein